MALLVAPLLVLFITRSICLGLQHQTAPAADPVESLRGEG